MTQDPLTTLIAAARVVAFGFGPGRQPMTHAETRTAARNLRRAFHAYDAFAASPEAQRQAHEARVLAGGEPA